MKNKYIQLILTPFVLVVFLALAYLIKSLTHFIWNWLTPIEGFIDYLWKPELFLLSIFMWSLIPYSLGIIMDRVFFRKEISIVLFVGLLILYSILYFSFFLNGIPNKSFFIISILTDAFIIYSFGYIAFISKKRIEIKKGTSNKTSTF